jgi:hypothetical protein
MMHGFLEGILKLCVKIFIDPRSPISKAAIDDLVDHLFGNFRSLEKVNMFRNNFTHGITNLTMIPADEWAGMEFTLLLLIRTEVGFNIVKESDAFGDEDIVIDFNNWPDDGIRVEVNDDKVESSNIPITTNKLSSHTEFKIEPEVQCSKNDLIQILEQLLSFHSFYNFGMKSPGPKEAF